MKDIQASYAKTHLPRLLAEVERGETLGITRHGKRIARIVPEGSIRQEEVDAAIGSLRELRGRLGKLTVEELLAARDAGRGD